MPVIVGAFLNCTKALRGVSPEIKTAEPEPERVECVVC